MVLRPGRSVGAALGLALLVFIVGPAGAQLPSPSGTQTLILRQFGAIPPPSPTPSRPAPRVSEEQEKPMPRSWIIAGSIAGALVLLGLVYVAVRVWRSSNLFDRQYRFPPAKDVAVRLGGEKCGVHMATVHFGADKPRVARSKAEDV